jgi:hypothetical protein
MSRTASFFFSALLLCIVQPVRAEAPDATAIVKAAIECWRDVSSYAMFEIQMSF